MGQLVGTHVVVNQRYRADNGRYSDLMFLQDIKDNDQQIIFCDVEAHHQDEIVEKKIRDLVDNSRSRLIYVLHFLTEVIKEVLWPLALKVVVPSHNEIKLDVNLLLPEDNFSLLKVKKSAKEEHTLFCPIYYC